LFISAKPDAISFRAETEYKFSGDRLVQWFFGGVVCFLFYIILVKLAKLVLSYE